MVGHKRKRARKRNNARRPFKPISVEQACEIGNFKRAYFYRVVVKHLDTRHLGRRRIVNEHSVYDYIRSLPS